MLPCIHFPPDKTSFPVKKENIMFSNLYKAISFILLLLSTPSPVKAQTEYIVRVNPLTGIPTKIDSIPGVRYLYSNASYNQSTHEYTVKGMWQPGQSPVYLYTLNVLSGHTLFKPLLPNNSIISIQYSRSTGILYGITIQNNIYYLVTVDKTTGTYSVIKDIPGADGVGSFVIDEANQRLFLRAVDHNPSFALWTIDLATGNIISHVSTSNINELMYDNVTHKLYALAGRTGPPPGYISTISICSVEPSTGVVTNIADLPGVSGITSGGFGTYNENDHLFLFAGIEHSSQVYLYSVDVNTGNIVSKPPIDAWNQPNRDNLVFFRYDNISQKLYALLWEAKTIPPVLVDSTCRLDLQTRIYPNPTRSILIIEKNPTLCKVIMNLYNSVGQLVLKEKPVNDGHNEFQLSFLSGGLYFYELIADGKASLKGKIVKQ